MRRSPLSSLFAALGVLALVATVAGCGGSDFDPATYLAPNKLRILATSAEPAEPKPGDQVTLTALVVDPAGSPMKDITVEWRRCTLTVNAAATTAVNQDCLTREDAEALTPLGTGHIITFTLPTIPQSQLSLPDGTFGIYTPIRVTVRAPGGRVLDGIYRLRVHPGQSPLPPNTNPTLAGLWFVDYVTVFDEDTADKLIEQLRPALYAKGTDYTAESVPERDDVAAYGGRTAITGDPKDHATTSVLAKLRQVPDTALEFTGFAIAFTNAGTLDSAFPGDVVGLISRDTWA